MPHTSPPGPSQLPVSAVVSRTPAPGRADELVAWAHGITAAASGVPGHVGARVYPPSPPDRDDVVIAFTFADAGSLAAWERSDLRRDWLDRGRALVAGPARAHAFTGFEGLFVPGARAGGPPPRWKTACIIALALFPVSLLLNWLLAPQVASWPLVARVALTTALIVPFMTWLGVPLLSRWLRRWLTGG